MSLEKVYCLNRTTGQTLETTDKAFNSIYRDKGFELITRTNVDAANPAIGSGAKARKHEPASVTGSAAAIAAGLGIGELPPETPEVMTFPEAAAKAVRGDERAKAKPTTTETAGNAEIDAKGSASNEIESDVDGAAITGEREPNKRDRGGRK